MMVQHRGTFNSIVRLAFLTLLVLSFFNLKSQDLKRIVDLQGIWKFTIGDNENWARPDFNDAQWEEIRVPGNWESQGFNGYDGYAWYRTTAILPPDLKEAACYLKLGYIDDVDEVYINGIRIGQTGQFPPDYSTAFRADRLYIIPHKIECTDGEISIAVRVFDEGGEGGFIQGEVSIVADLSAIKADFDLQGTWKFKTGECSGIPIKMDYQNWGEITVPGTWEDQGYKDYDGVACYATEFELNGRFGEQRMVLILGRIDDLDMVYLNGVFIGQAGEFNVETVWQRPDVYKQIRGYYIPPGILKDKDKNVLVVKVLDNGGLGGIWDGTIGLITQDNYIRHWRNKRSRMR
ncbi:MAG: hypothetical protein K9H16_12135 [Bacteroidales bacterium]|nr:hypothetical protein [Bacteroidales bacterium]